MAELTIQSATSVQHSYGIRYRLSNRRLLHGRRREPSSRQLVAAPRTCCDLSSSLLEGVATYALKSRLQRYRTVQASIKCNTFGLLAGQVEAVDIKGQGWVSPLGLSARLLEVCLGAASLDVQTLLTQQRIQLENVPTGRARVVFSAIDFGRFLEHPLMRTAASTAVQGQRFAFDVHSVRLEAANGRSGTIHFAGHWEGDGQRYSCSMQHQAGRAQVTSWGEHHPAEVASSNAVPSKNTAGHVSGGLTEFFSNLTLDLQGPKLTYCSMTVRNESLQQLGSVVVDLQLEVKVTAFPPVNLEF